MTTKFIWAEISTQTLKSLSDYQVMIVMWWWKGDEGKWGDAYMLAKHIAYDLIIGPIWGPNAWHTVVDDEGRQFVGHNLPWSSVAAKEVFLWQGKYINISWLQDELNDLHSLEKEPKIKVAAHAHCIFSSLHGKIDMKIENFKKWTGTEVGTTSI